MEAYGNMLYKTHIVIANTLCAEFVKQYRTIGYFRWRHISQIDYDVTFHKENFHKWLVPTSYEAVNKRIFRRKLFTN